MVEIEMKDVKKKHIKRKRTSSITSNTSSVPVLPWMRSPIDVSEFEDCSLDLVPFLDPRLEDALQRMGFSSLFPVQVAVWQETIGPGAFERDLCINSPTGTGKTLAYALPIVQKLSTRVVKCIRALVVLPTRDLALQVKEVFAAIAPAVGLSVGLAVGQSSIEDEISELIKRTRLEAGICYDPEDHGVDLQSSVDILVATPGRLMDHINTTKGFTLEHLCYLVVDETDRLLREAYQSWLPTVLQLTHTNEDIFSHARKFAHSMIGSLKTIRKSGVERGCKGKTSPRLMKMVLSATLTRDPSKLSQLDLYHPLFLTTGPQRYQLPEKLECYKLLCKSNDKSLNLVALLQDLKGEKCIVFLSSVESAQKLSILLNSFELPFKIKLYSGLQHQSVRSKTLRAFREGETQVLVASDAMTRGMDVEGVRTVINYDAPAYIKTYVHRAGRTARAGQAGRCFSLLVRNEVDPFKKMLQKVDRNSCSVYPLPDGLIESFRPQYTAALAKLKEFMESRTSRRHKISLKSQTVVKEKNIRNLEEI
ncbi:Dead-box atp-dependent rna helicase [Thalictrum thalictroides]|uniref:ATP-dependent RNA helicase n=1 Tax=Thalictrum thalictroides TaxID=46969 RepID=A0A7J6VTX2_THATH|nr:Dead-box atp-dependent rna helicase [Thalictrum thalictroides]